jgi:hypothetical protein
MTISFSRSFDHMLQLAKLAAAFAVELGSAKKSD